MYVASEGLRLNSRLRIIVLGYIVRGPLGGMAWHHLQYVLGLAHLGHDVYFLEDSDDYPSCYDPQRHVTDTDPSYGLGFAERAFDRIGMPGRWAYYDAHEQRWLGPCAEQTASLCETAELLINVSGINPLRSWFIQIPHRVLVDTDPVFTQIRHLTDSKARAQANKHTCFFSFGENVSGVDGQIPDDGFAWRATRQPIVLEAWPRTPPVPQGSYTTVMQWDSYKSILYKGWQFGMKSASFKSFLDLPGKTPVTLELALGNEHAPRKLLQAEGWEIRNPLELSSSLDTYQRYLQGSKAEFSVAKQGYVVSRSAWFSERSACYLATGRPVIVQDTGFSDNIETGRGLFAFKSQNQAITAIEAVEANYSDHCVAARELARQYFDAGKVLTRLIEMVFAKGA
ncbi:MAG: glycosyltransferase family 4 protein [Gammaproteobacteria bacterium]|nr:glycosyltransferase family 4 protein [Gammaproteobacteria bacterium]